ncbi:formylglycine-generating enzyme family protein, partial [Myxococcota bacterium]|nr:formylglycine-generating enzyme family protein [Myxococcota bacterium]
DAQDELPVYNVSWFASVMFAEWVGARLPSELEWEYACRAGTTTRFWSGDTDDDLERIGWINRNSGKHPHLVAQKPKNAWGLHDVHGNVSEWCVDVYDPEAYSRRADGLTVDPQHLTFAFGSNLPQLAEFADRGVTYVLRGGSWLFRPVYACSTFRYGHEPSAAHIAIGFRPMLSRQEPP